MSRNDFALNDFVDSLKTLRVRPAKSVLFGMVHRFSAEYPITKLCRMLAVSRSGFYKWFNRRQRPDRDLVIRDHMVAIQKTGDSTYGYRRMIHELQRRIGIKFNHKRVYRIMRKYGLLSHTPCRSKTRIIRKAAECFNNLINGDFTAEAPNEKWCIDLSEYRTEEGKIHISVIEDFHDRSVVAHSIGLSPSHHLVKQTISLAMHQFSDSPDHRIVLHSDQGSTFKGAKYRRMLNKLHIDPSHSRKGCPTQNAVIESFFATLKKECLHRYLNPLWKYSYPVARKLQRPVTSSLQSI